ncbi:peptidoglycan transpeptidase precursor (ErfK-YbiS-YhnG family) [Williamsia limnetica]|uniref:Peptidoglycan transpeptidase (ErfK-YbiS-YhnG family) n=1 Tax=Williamsia limnetica TaxID=882452 RepID=A0A318RNM5_WILLI|nr:peptidoglycan transpeptidase precursor (ErfK-YbiS-YhnG family) [Williamsia limnetica]
MSERHRSSDGQISRRGLLIAGGGALAAALAACASGGSTTQKSSTPPPVPEARVTFEPPAATVGFDPVGAVLVSVVDGTLVDVVMTNDEGRVIPGVMTPDTLAWKPDTPLGYAKTYQLQATTRDAAGRTRSVTSTFSTVEPNNLTMPSFVTTGGGAMRDGATYGVGMVTVVHFDEPITDRVAAQKALSVETEPAVEGQWNWVDDQNVHWRPREYFTPGTKVTARAMVYAIDLGDGLYGQDDAMCSFTIGDSHVSIADDTTKQVGVYINGELVRTMPTSMGRGGTETVNGKTIHFWTQSGTYTVLDKANPVIMDSSTYGLPVNSRLGYRETINWATRISNDGIYLHQLEDTIPQQGNTNMSSGCLNLNPENAKWFYDLAVTGDVVEVRNTGGPALELWQNGDWGVPWETWTAGSAL